MFTTKQNTIAKMSHNSNSATRDGITSSLVDRFIDIFDKEVMIDVKDDDDDVIRRPCIFRVPKTLSWIKPEAYIPQLVALGPYHRFRKELSAMERHKYVAVKRLLEPDHILKKPDQRHHFRQLIIPKLKDMERTIRACYHEFLQMDEDTLAWILATDGFFLLYSLRIYAKEETNSEVTKLIQDAIIRDVMMLENQIPVILLIEIWNSVSCSSSGEDSDDHFRLLLLDFIKAQSPLKFTVDKRCRLDSCGRHVHLLALMYDLIVNNSPVRDACQDCSLENTKDQDEMEPEASSSFGQSNSEEGFLNNFLGILDVVASLRITSLCKLQRPFMFIRNLPWTKIGKAFGCGKDTQNSKADEIEIPLVSSLIDIGGVKFKPTLGGIRDIKFDEAMATVYLPTITLDHNSEVILRNLVAYESTMVGRPVEIAQYVDFMSGIIDTAEDAKFLKDSKIIDSKLPDTRIAEMFNGMNKSNWKQVEMTELAHAVRKINEHFGSRVRVKAYRAIRKYVYPYWKFLTVLSTIFLLLMMSLQSFCQVYDCSQFFGRRSLM